MTGLSNLLANIQFINLFTCIVVYLGLKDKWDSARRAATLAKEQIRKGSIGKPLVEQYEELRYCAKEMKDHTVRIIVTIIN